jgi:hypothetical protein
MIVGTKREIPLICFGVKTCLSLKKLEKGGIGGAFSEGSTDLVLMLPFCLLARQYQHRS